MRKYELFTIGYEGREIDEFIDCLRRFNISRLIDVREIPISRKKGFSKSALRERLQEKNIEYVHIKALGSPSDLRNKVRSDEDYDYFFKAYSQYLSQNVEAIEELYQYIVSDKINCIMCFEKSIEKCHRSVIADRIKKHHRNRIKITHI